MTSINQIIPATPGWYAVFVSEDTGKIYTDYSPVAAWKASKDGQLLPMITIDEVWVESCEAHNRLEYHPFKVPKDEVRQA